MFTARYGLGLYIIKDYLNPQHPCSGSGDYSPSSFISKRLAVGSSAHPHHRQVKEVAGQHGEIFLSSSDDRLRPCENFVFDSDNFLIKGAVQVRLDQERNYRHKSTEYEVVSAL